MAETTKEERKKYRVYRSLAEKTYALRLYPFCLTEADIGLCMIFALLIWFVIDEGGFANVVYLDMFRLDPWGWIFPGLLLALTLSILHRIRPEGDSDQIVGGLLSVKRYGARMPFLDRYYTSPDYRFYGGKASLKRDKRRKKNA